MLDLRIENGRVNRCIVQLFIAVTPAVSPNIGDGCCQKFSHSAIASGCSNHPRNALVSQSYDQYILADLAPGR